MKQKTVFDVGLSLSAALVSLLLVTGVSAAPPRKCPVFDCLPYLLSTDLSKISDLFNYESLVGITRKDDSGIEDREKAVQDVCTSYMKFDNCFGGNWWECFDIAELLSVAKDAFSYLQLPGGGDLSELTERQVVSGLKVASFVCNNWDKALNNSYCIRSSIVRNNTIYQFFVKAGWDMGKAPESISCDRFKNLFHLFVYILANNCASDLANATNTVLTMGMQAIPTYNLSDCNFMTFDEIMSKKPNMTALENFKLLWNEGDEYINKTTKKPNTAQTTTTRSISAASTIISQSGSGSDDRATSTASGRTASSAVTTSGQQTTTAVPTATSATSHSSAASSSSSTKASVQSVTVTLVPSGSEETSTAKTVTSNVTPQAVRHKPTNGGDRSVKLLSSHAVALSLSLSFLFAITNQLV